MFLIDNRNEPDPTDKIKDPYVVHYGPDLHLRRLYDGSQYQVVKVMYDPDELRSLLGDQGWTARLEATRLFVFGDVRVNLR